AVGSRLYERALRPGRPAASDARLDDRDDPQACGELPQEQSGRNLAARRCGNAAMRIMLLSLVLLACLADAAAADARRRPSRPHHHHEGWHDRWENRRDARRAGVLTGIIVSGVAGAAARSEAEQRYRECLY